MIAAHTGLARAARDGGREAMSAAEASALSSTRTRTDDLKWPVNRGHASACLLAPGRGADTRAYWPLQRRRAHLVGARRETGAGENGANRVCGGSPRAIFSALPCRELLAVLPQAVAGDRAYHIAAGRRGRGGRLGPAALERQRWFGGRKRRQRGRDDDGGKL